MMIKTAEMLFRAPEADKPTVLLMIDRNELEDQMLKNLAALGLGNLEHASSIRRLNELLKNDYRGIIVTMIHKFRDMPADLNLRKNIYVLIDEAHRTTGGDLGNFLMAGLPNASYIGFTGTPEDKTAFGKGTFKTFGVDDDEGYLHKYSIADTAQRGARSHFRRHPVGRPRSGGQHRRRDHAAALLSARAERDAGAARDAG